MSIVHYYPKALEELQRWLGRDLDEPFEYRSWMPHVDIHEKTHQFVVRADMPGVKKQDVQVIFENGVLTVSGKRESVYEEKEQGKVIRCERSQGEFSRSFALPKSVDSAKIKATMEEGVLTITIPKASESISQSIKVE